MFPDLSNSTQKELASQNDTAIFLEQLRDLAAFSSRFTGTEPAGAR
jgi:hypothetical protein